MTYKRTRKPNFRSTEAKNVKRKALKFPMIGRLMMLVMLLVSQHVSAQDKMTEQAIEQVVRASLDKEIAEMAKFRQWPKYHAEYEFWVPGSAKHLPACQVPLDVSGRDNQSMPVGHLKRLVSCNQSQSAWKINVTVKSAITMPVVVAKSVIRRGETVNINALQLVTKTLKHESSVFTRLSQAAGREARRQVRTGQILSPVFIVAPDWVEKGNEVVVIAAQNGFEASTKGIALENGSEGDQIEVQNSSSQKVIRAVVTGVNEVHTQF